MFDLLDRRLRIAGLLFAAGSAVHLLDHLRRGQGTVPDAVYWAGTLALVPQIVVVTLILTRHRLAPLVAAASGPVLAVGFFATHWLPGPEAISDPVWQIESLQGLSYAASLIEVAGAAALGIAGIAVVRARGLESFATNPPPITGRE